MDYWTIFATIMAVALIPIYISKRFTSPIFGVYSQPGRWYYSKLICIYCLLWIRQLRSRFATDDEATSLDPGRGVKAETDVKKMESVQALADHPLAVNAVFLACGGRDGTYLSAGIARRKLGVKNTLFCLRLPQLGVLLFPSHPDSMVTTGLKAYPMGGRFLLDKDTHWESNGLVIKMVEPMKRWSLSYNGQMVSQSTGESHQVQIQAEYRSEIPYFDFTCDLDKWTLARAIAKESWTREYFDRLKSDHQSHYEQFGRVCGTAVVDGDRAYPLDMDCMRDHTQATKRDWRLMRRYAFHFFATAHGYRGVVGVVSQLPNFSHFEIGYVYSPTNQIFPIQQVQFPLWRHGENGVTPKDYCIAFKFDGEWHELQVKILDCTDVFMGWEWEARLEERFAVYKMDGVEGWGVSEWNYRNFSGRPSKFSDKDPQHLKHVQKY